MKTYSKEFAQNWINKYNNSEAKAEGYDFEDFIMDHMMDYGENEAESIILCEEINNPTEFARFCEEINGGKL